MLSPSVIRVALTAVSACGLFACASQPRDVALPATAGDQAPAGAEASSQSTAGEAESLAVWREPVMQRRLAESYFAESDVEPTLDDDERELLASVMEHVGAEHLDAAADLLTGVAGPAASATIDYTLGTVRFQQERLDDAAVAYRSAVDKFPKYLRAWRNLAQIEFRRGDFARAVTAFSRVLEIGGGDAVTYGLLGVAHTRTDAPMAAETAFRAATMLDPTNLDWQKGLAESLFRQARFADAAALFDQLVRAEPDRAELWLAQGEAYARLGRGMDAAKNFEMVDDLGGSTVDSLNNLGDIYANEQLFDLAVDAYERALQRFETASLDRPMRAAKFLSANGAHDASRRLVDAIETTAAARLTTEQQKDLLKIRVRLAAASGASEEEARVLAEIVAMDPLDGEALLLLGLHAARSGDTERAILHYERAAAIEGFEADAKVRHAQLLVGKGDYAPAIQLLTRAQTVRPRDNVREYLEQVERIARQR